MLEDRVRTMIGQLLWENLVLAEQVETLRNELEALKRDAAKKDAAQKEDT